MTVRTGGTGAITVIVCALTELVKPISADISAAAFVTTPKAVPLTVNVTVQTAPAATLMPLVVKGCVAFTAVKVGAPQLLLLGAVGFAIVNPLRKVSLNVIPVLLTAFAALLSIVKESVVVCPRSTEDVAKALVANINTPDLAFKNTRDSTEKGYLNTFNHFTAQAIITSCFSEELADFVADMHERDRHPELITGRFTPAQIADLGGGPVDNYVDIVNNEWGQEIGKQLKVKYGINRATNWTPELLANYLNDMQAYYIWAFQIGFKPFRPEDKVVRVFANKMNTVLRDD